MFVYAEVLKVGGSCAFQSDGEYRQVVQFNVLAVEHKLLDAVDHVFQHTVNDAGRIRRVVFRHVAGQLLGVVSFVAHRACVPVTVVGARAHLVLIKFESNHKF